MAILLYQWLGCHSEEGAASNHNDHWQAMDVFALIPDFVYYMTCLSMAYRLSIATARAFEIISRFFQSQPSLQVLLHCYCFFTMVRPSLRAIGASHAHCTCLSQQPQLANELIHQILSNLECAELFPCSQVSRSFCQWAARQASMPDYVASLQ